MGVFDVHCAYSGVPLIGDTQLVLLLEAEPGWKVISAPLRGDYDRYGQIECDGGNPAGKASFQAFLNWCSRDLQTDNLDRILAMMRDLEAVWHGHRISYALIDGGVYDALLPVFSAPHEHLPTDLHCPWKTELDGVGPIDMEDTDQYCGFGGVRV